MNRLPDDVAVRCLAALPFVDVVAAARVSKAWNKHRKSHAFRTSRAETDERALVFAGYLDDEHIVDITDCYAFVQGRWYEIAPTPGQRIDGGGMVVGNELWHLTKCAATARRAAVQSRAYSLETNTWRSIELGEDERILSQVSDGQFIVTWSRVQPYGGNVPWGEVTYVIKSHLVGGNGGWIEVPLPPLGMDDSARCCVNGIYYVVGGLRDSFDAMQAYDLESRSWSVLPSMPRGRFSALLVVVDGKILVVGGCEQGEDAPRSRSIISFDPETETWSDVAELPQTGPGRLTSSPWGSGMAATAHEGKLVVFGVPDSPPLMLLEDGEWEELPEVFWREPGQTVMDPCLASLKLW